MISLLQRVRQARVEVDGQVVGAIGAGLLVLVCAERGDTEAEADKLLAKMLKLRIFSDDAGKMNKSVQDLDGQGGVGGLLLVSQFTLAADTTGGNRPSFSHAAPPEDGRRLYEYLVARARQAAGHQRAQALQAGIGACGRGHLLLGHNVTDPGLGHALGGGGIEAIEQEEHGHHHQAVGGGHAEVDYGEEDKADEEHTLHPDTVGQQFRADLLARPLLGGPDDLQVVLGDHRQVGGVGRAAVGAHDTEV